MGTPTVQADPEAQAASWDLAPLVDGDEASGADTLLSAAEVAAEEFAADLEGRVTSLDAARLTEAMRKLAEIKDLVLRAFVYAELRFAVDSGDAQRGALLQSVKERRTAVETRLQFFELEWAAAEEEWVQAVLAEAGAELEFALNHLRVIRQKRPYLLSAAEERVLAETRITGQQAWMRLFEEQYAAAKAKLDGETVPFSVAYNQWFDADRPQRIKAVDAMIAATAPMGRERAFIFNTLLHDRAVEDRLRGYPTWISSRNLSNQISDAAVDALVDAVQSRYDIAHRWYAVKARLLGLERLTAYDLYGPVRASTATIPYADARELVVSVYQGFSPQAGAVARRFFDEHWIDAPVRPNKSGGAFCETGGVNRHPYVLLNYGGRRQDVLTMAHELGHGLHDVLAAPRGTFHQEPPLTLAETASTFGESLVLEQLLQQADSDDARLSILAEALDSSMLAIFWQVAFNRFEDRIHTLRREEGELSVEQFDAIFNETTLAYLGPSVDQVPGIERFWTMVPHFYLWPGYVYAYAFGLLLSLSIFARYREIGSSFVPQYLEMLASGGSRPPEDTVAIVGLDLRDPEFWATGLELVDRQLQAVEELAATMTAPPPPPNG